MRRNEYSQMVSVDHVKLLKRLETNVRKVSRKDRGQVAHPRRPVPPHAGHPEP